MLRRSERGIDPRRGGCSRERLFRTVCGVRVERQFGAVSALTLRRSLGSKLCPCSERHVRGSLWHIYCHRHNHVASLVLAAVMRAVYRSA